MNRYEYLDHTGDIGLRVYGTTLVELFTNAACALLETMADINTIEEQREITLELSAETVEALFVAWLDELIFRHEVEEILFRRVEIQTLSQTPPQLSALVFGETGDTERHTVYTEVKSVTYHQLFVEQNPDGTWVAQVIFDL